MSQSTMSIRVDQTLKKKFDALCEAFGMSTTAALNIFMKAVVREKRIPFEIRVDNEELIKQNAISALSKMRQSVASRGMDMSLEEINEEIKATRDAKREKNLRCH